MDDRRVSEQSYRHSVSSWRVGLYPESALSNTNIKGRGMVKSTLEQPLTQTERAQARFSLFCLVPGPTALLMISKGCFGWDWSFIGVTFIPIVMAYAGMFWYTCIYPKSQTMVARLYREWRVNKKHAKIVRQSGAFSSFS